MRVGINLSYLFPGRALGHQRVCEGLISGWTELAAQGELRFEPLLIPSIEIRPVFERFGLRFARRSLSARSSFRRVVGENLHLSRICREEALDVLFCPGNAGPLRCERPIVVTLQDLHHRQYPERYALARKLFFDVVAEASYRKAARVVVPSRFTAGQAKHYLGLDTRVIPYSPEPTVRRPLRAPTRDPAAPGRFFVSISAAIPHKNVDLLVQAFRSYRALGGRVGLVLVGPHHRAAGTEGVTVLQNIADEDLLRLYDTAVGVVSASEYEGFGLPLAEALASGCPVLAPRRASIPEVVGTDGCYFDDLRPEPMARALLSFEGARRLPLRSGRYGQRTWSQVAAEYAAVFNEALKQ